VVKGFVSDYSLRPASKGNSVNGSMGCCGVVVLWCLEQWVLICRYVVWNLSPVNLTASSGGLLWTREWTFGLKKRWVIIWLGKWVLTAHEKLCSIALARYHHKRKTFLRWEFYCRLIYEYSKRWCGVCAIGTKWHHSNTTLRRLKFIHFISKIKSVPRSKHTPSRL
jgi:hypothetical protein